MTWPFKDDQKWNASGHPFTGVDLRHFYDAIVDRRAGFNQSNGVKPHLVGATSGSDRAVDRALQLLKKAGLIRYEKGRWVKT